MRCLPEDAAGEISHTYVHETSAYEVENFIFTIEQPLLDECFRRRIWPSIVVVMAIDSGRELETTTGSMEFHRQVFTGCTHQR